MTPDLIPVFLNGRPLRVAAGTTLGALLAEHEPDLLAAFLGASARATDGRLIAVAPEAPLAAGAILLVRRVAGGGELADA